MARAEISTTINRPVEEVFRGTEQSGEQPEVVVGAVDATKVITDGGPVVVKGSPGIVEL